MEVMTKNVKIRIEMLEKQSNDNPIPLVFFAFRKGHREEDCARQAEEYQIRNGHLIKEWESGEKIDLVKFIAAPVPAIEGEGYQTYIDRVRKQCHVMDDFLGKWWER